MNNTLTGLFLLLTIIITIFFAYYITIIIGKKTKMLMNGRYVHVLERTVIGLNTSISIVKVNKRIYVMVFQGKTIKVLDKIDECDWEILITENQNLFNFKDEINDIIKKKLLKK